MGFRFQRRVTLFPGVRLNFSARGISTTLGVRGASVTLGGRSGPMLNLGIPGTGFSFRQQLVPGRHAVPEPASVPEVPPPAVPSVASASAAVAIESAPVAEVTSEGLGQLKTLFAEVSAERERLRGESASATRDLETAEARLARAKNWFLRLFLGRKVPERTAAVEAAQAKVKELEARLEGAFLDAEFGLDEGAHAAFAEVVAAFGDLATCSRIWDVTSTRVEDRRVTRSAASLAVDRTPVSFTAAEEDDVIQASTKALKLGNANGPDLVLYPAFVLLRTDGDVAFVDVREIQITYSASRCVERDEVAPDAEVVGQAWLKSNKDGSPDRRFAGNRQIPVARYGKLTLMSPGGLSEQYMLSQWAKAERFAQAFNAYIKRLPALTARTEQPRAFASRAVEYLRKARAATPEQAANEMQMFSTLVEADLATIPGKTSLDEVERVLTGLGTIMPALRAYFGQNPALAPLQAIAERSYPKMIGSFAGQLRGAVAQAGQDAKGDDVAQVEKVIRLADAVLADAGGT
jgi:hypothetical protein